MAQAVSTEKHLPELLTAAELAAYLDVPVSTIHFWRGRKQGPPALKVGRRLMFRAADVADWLEAQSERPEMREAGFPASEPLADENVNEQPTA
jgi:excisionase family DNA binding protein